MENLPAGWSVSNSTGSYSTPAHKYDDDDGDDDGLRGDEGLEAEDLRPDSPGWEDMENDTEELNLKCLLCDEKLHAVRAMVDHCKQTHSFDLDEIRKANKVDFYNTMKLINYIRSQVRSGSSPPDCVDPKLWADDKFLQPVVEDDALLYSIDELADPKDPNDPLAETQEEGAEGDGAGHKVLAERAVR
ncbi:hypothetical protein LTR36_005813 [Oleoguttula mirabilis]|uniref:type I protein arginine methyltransferase n=1 Tax=Oleoguttula mirabilis TaxID=1507867 RepID=A0AAV9JDC0_9PEZI|nr:hypothetical protein LTR36_005813 [Oleoguttula mirabilis]